MFRSKKGKKEAPGITTASLPDIVFMLLCFFMVVTKMKDSEMKVKIAPPSATELEKLEKKELVSHIFVGKPTPRYAKIGTGVHYQLNDQLISEAILPNKLPQFIQNERLKVEKQSAKLVPKMTAALRVDGKVKMGYITDLKDILRSKEVDFRRVSYIANERVE